MQLAQLNIAQAKASLDSPVMVDFVNNLDRINTLADQSEGFVWRLRDEDGGDATQIRVFDNDFIIVNMSVWNSRDALFRFVYATGHTAILKRKKEWFENMRAMHMVLWYVPVSHQPTLQEGLDKLEYLREHGESPLAFTFKNDFKPSDLVT